jgi:hypothetical protein
MNLFQKQPADQLDYDLDFSEWLTGSDTITGAVAVSDAPDEDDELVVESVSITDQQVKVWLSGGITGSTYKVTATITTSEGRVKELDFKIRVRNL